MSDPALTERANTETLDTLDSEHLRHLIRTSREILRARGLIPDSFIRKEYRVRLQDLKDLRVAAFRFGVSPAGIADQCVALLASPQLVVLRSRDGEWVTLTPVLNVSHKSPRGNWAETVALLGTGRILRTGSHRYNQGENLALGEYVPVNADGHPPEDFRIYGEPFIRAWERLAVKPNTPAFQAILQTAARHDTPQEALISWCVGRIKEWFQAQWSTGTLLTWIMCPDSFPKGLLLRDILTPALRGTAEGAQKKKDEDDEIAGYFSVDGLVKACEQVLIQKNLIEPDLAVDDTLAIPIADVWTWYLHQRQLANTKANRLRAAVTTLLGFVPIWIDQERAWVKAARPIPALLQDATPHWQRGHALEWLRSNPPNVAVTDGYRILINGEFRCVVEGKSAELPKADQIVRRMLTVATRHREQIATLTDDLPVLEQLFRDVPAKRLWALLGRKERVA